MKVCAKFAALALIAFFLAVVDVLLADSLPRQEQLRAYALRNNPNSVDISPDEQLVATECTKTIIRADSSTNTLEELVQIWNFKEDRLVAEFSAVRTELRAPATGYSKDFIRGARIVRFSPNGLSVVALIDQTIYILRATDLAKLQAISLVDPGIVTQNVHGITVEGKTFVRSLEISPDGNAVAIFRVGEPTFGSIEIYELSSGRNTQSWETPKGWSGSTNGLHWHPNGKLILIAIPNAISCQSSHHEADVFAFDVLTGTIKYKLTTGMPYPRIAVSSDSRVFAANGGCTEFGANIRSKLKVFDLTSGKHLLDVSGNGTSVGYSISTSADGTRFAAFTGNVKKKFDWGDLVSDYVLVDRKFSIWSLTNYEGIVTSQNIPDLNPDEIRLSWKGRFAVSSGNASFVYQLP
jgi:hypothetical protein